MEINTEALQSLSLADLFALSNHCDIMSDGTYEDPDNTEHKQWEEISTAVIQEYQKRIANIFIF